MKLTPRALCALPLALALGGCAQVVGIDDFTVTGGAGESTLSTGIYTGGICSEVNGCSREMAHDYTGGSEDTVGVSFSFEKGYSLACIRIRIGMSVKFNSDKTFDDIPIAGGISPVQDKESPIKNPDPSDVTEAVFPLAGKCVFPYFSPKYPDKKGAVFIGGE